MPLIIVSANVREIFSIKKGADRIWNRKFTRQAIVTTSLGYFRIFWSKVQYWWAWLLCIPRPLIIVSGHQWNVNACTLGMTNSTTDAIYFFFFSNFFFLKLLLSPRQWTQHMFIRPYWFFIRLTRLFFPRIGLYKLRKMINHVIISIYGLLE